MGFSAVPDSHWSQLSDVIAAAMGLHFPRERWADLQRGLAGAAGEFGFPDVAACADWLLSASPTEQQQQVLVEHLTIGETYFFREKKTFEVIATNVLPELIRARRGREPRLRLWSAACCSGEEAYSLAIMLRQLLPDLADWRVTILGTDINRRFLRKAIAGAYSEWSFRDAPAGIKERYFDRRGDGQYVVLPEIRDMVTFAHLNLVEDSYPSLLTGANAMDLIFCRNVLMYFKPAQAVKVIGNLRRALIEGGWLVVSPSEVARALFPEFVTRNFPGVILYQNDTANVRVRRTPTAEPPTEASGRFVPDGQSPSVPPVEVASPSESPTSQWWDEPVAATPSPTLYSVAGSLYEQGRYVEAVETLLTAGVEHTSGQPVFSLLARALANQGKLVEALVWCDRWIAYDRLDCAAHYLRAVVLIEQSDMQQARRSLQRAVYVRPDFAVAHFALGNLARDSGKNDEAGKYFDNAIQLLGRYQPDDLLPGADGLTAGRLLETIITLTAWEHL